MVAEAAISRISLVADPFDVTRNKISAERLMEVLHYNPVTGYFTWKTTLSNRAAKGSVAGSRQSGTRRGVVIGVDGVNYQAHLLAWLYIYGEFPKNEIDHVNGNFLDNRLDNLRLCSRSQNMFNRGANSNNKLGIKGVCIDRQTGKFRAFIMAYGKKQNLGRFISIHDAKRAYDNAALELHKEFARVL